jgi:hypothetical protein
MMKIVFTYLFCVLANLGKMMKLGYTYLLLCAGKPRKNYEIRIHLPVPVCWKTFEK